MLCFRKSHLIVALGLVVSAPTYAACYGIAVNGGFGNSGGTSFIAPKFAPPKAGKCKSWVGFTKTATTVVATATGTGCHSSDGRVLTFSIFNTDPPFGRKPGDPPALTDAEIDDVVAFLGTLTDGYDPGQ